VLVLALVLGCSTATGASLQPSNLQVGGGEDSWHPQQMFALSWSNPPGIAAAHYRLLSPSG
jgi:hypothetical protein